MALQFNSKINLVFSFDFTEGYILERSQKFKKNGFKNYRYHFGNYFQY